MPYNSCIPYSNGHSHLLADWLMSEQAGIAKKPAAAKKFAPAKTPATALSTCKRSHPSQPNGSSDEDTEEDLGLVDSGEETEKADGKEHDTSASEPDPESADAESDPMNASNDDFNSD